VAEDKTGRLWIATSGGAAILENEHIVSFAQWLTAHPASANSEPPAADSRTRRDQANAAPRAARPQAADRADARNEAASAISSDATGEAQAVFVDASSTVWLATERGVWFYDGNRLGRVDVDGLRAAAVASNAKPRAPVIGIHQDHSRRMWFALAQGGALLYDTQRRESQRLSFVERDHVAAVYTGREGYVWFATENGVVSADFYSFVSFTTSRGLADNDVHPVVELPASLGANLSGKLWYLTAAGVSR